MSHPKEDEMLLLNSKQGDSFKVITKNEQLPHSKVHHPLLCNFMHVGGGSNLLEQHQVLGHISLDRIKQYGLQELRYPRYHPSNLSCMSALQTEQGPCQ